VGIIGSSAGGHLAATLLTHFDSGDPDAADPVERQSSRPDIGVLCYAVITMGQYTHQGSKDNVLGRNPSPELVQELSNETPCDLQNAALFPLDDGRGQNRADGKHHALRLRAAQERRPICAAHLPKGRTRHGPGGQAPFANPHPWAADCLFWLKEQKFVQ